MPKKRALPETRFSIYAHRRDVLQNQCASYRVHRAGRITGQLRLMSAGIDPHMGKWGADTSMPPLEKVRAPLMAQELVETRDW